MKRFINKIRAVEVIQAEIDKIILLRSLLETKGIYTANDRYKMKKFDSMEDDLLKESEDAKKILENKKILLERKSLMSQRALVE